MTSSRARAAIADLGAHVSVAGGLETCFRRARELGAGAIQIFVKNQRQWAARPLGAGEEALFAAERAMAGPAVRSVVAHATYLVNLASAVPAVFEPSVVTYAEELRRAERLGLLGVILHPGSSPLGREAAIERAAHGLALAMSGSKGRPILEVMPGGGSRIGGRFEDLRAIIDALPARLRPRVGVCLDTCHLHVAGYRICRPTDLEETLAELDSVVGLERLAAIHLNDSKGGFGSRLDRHANLGEGTIGRACFEAIVNHPRLAAVPKILETPHEAGGVERDLALLRAMRAKTKEEKDGIPGKARGGARKRGPDRDSAVQGRPRPAPGGR